MPLSGCHVVCAFTGSSSKQERQTSALGRPIWSETLAAGGVTSKAAPEAAMQGDAVFHVRATADAYGVVYGYGDEKTPPNEASADHPKIALPAGETVTVYVKKGDKLKYVVA